jgi:hypothetical protein
VEGSSLSIPQTLNIVLVGSARLTVTVAGEKVHTTKESGFLLTREFTSVKMNSIDFIG